MRLRNPLDTKPSPQNAVEPRSRTLLLAAGIASALLATVLYLQSLEFGYVYDDVVIAQSDIRLQDPDYYRTVWWEPWWYNSDSIGESRPLSSFTFWVEWQLFQGNPVPGHLVNVVLVACISFLVPFLAAAWTSDSRLAWPAGLVFAAHPIHTEAVVNLVGRAELLAALFTALALWGWFRWRERLNWPRALLIGLAVLLAGQSKETGYLAAAAILVAEVAERRRNRQPVMGRPWLVPFVVVISCVACYAVAQRAIVKRAIIEKYGFRADVVDPILNPLRTATQGERVVAPLQLTGKAAQLLLVPFNQTPDYGPREIVPTSNLLSSGPLLGLAVVGIWAGAVVFSWRRRSAALGPLLACLVAWAIPSNAFLLIGVIFGERLLFLLSLFATIAVPALILDVWSMRKTGSDLKKALLAGTAVLVAIFLGAMLFYVQVAAPLVADDYLLPKLLILGLAIAGGVVVAWRRSRKVSPALIIATIVLAYSLTAVFYVPYWQSWTTLVMTTSARHPHNAKFQGELSVLLLEQSVRLGGDMTAEAEAAARRAIDLWPYYHAPYITLACLAQEQGDAVRADQLLEIVVDAQADLTRYAFLLEKFGLTTPERDRR